MTTQTMDQIQVRLEPAVVPEWEADDLVAAELGAQIEAPDAATAEEMISSWVVRSAGARRR